MAFNEKTQTFDIVDDLRLLAGASAARVTVLGYYIAGDGGYGQYYWDTVSVETDNGGTVIKPTAVTGAGRWKLLHNGVVNAANFGVTTGATAQNARITAALAVTDIKTLVFNHLITKSYTIASAIVVPADVTIKFDNDNKFVFSGGTLTGGTIDCDFKRQCFAGDLTPSNVVTGLDNTTISIMWFGAKPDTTSSVTGTDCLLAAQKTVLASTILNKIYIPGTTKGTAYQYYYRFSAPWIITKNCIIYGDGFKGQTNLKFPGNGSGITLAPTVGGATLENVHLRGTFSSESDGFNSLTANGVTFNNDCRIKDVYVLSFDGSGFFVDGVGPNANSWKMEGCRAYNNGRAGLYTNGADANAGRCEGFVAQGNAVAGILDDSFLGNVYDGGSIGTSVYSHAQQRTLITYKAAVSHGGNRYRVLIASTNIEPGVTAGWATYWTLIEVGGLDATYQAWSNSRAYGAPKTYWARVNNIGIEPTITTNWDISWRDWVIAPSLGLQWFADQTYIMGGAQIYQNLNARTLVDGVYNEGDGPVEFRSPGLVVGGFSAQHANNNAIWGSTNNRIFTGSQFNIQGIKYGADVFLATSERIGLQSFARFTDTDSAGYVDLLGGQTDGFTPILRFHPMNSATGSGNVNSFIYADGPDTGSVAALIIASRNLSAGLLTTQPVLDIRNHTTSVLKIAATGQLTNNFLVGTGNRLLQTSSTGALSASTIDPASIATPTFVGLPDGAGAFTGNSLKVVRVNVGETSLEYTTFAGGGDALTTDPLSQFASTTSDQLRLVISDETGAGAAVFASGATLIAPLLSGVTQGSVLFAGPSGLITQDNANLFWNDSSNFLGVGTATPTTRLDVAYNQAIIGKFINTATSGTSAGGFIQLGSNDGAATATGDRLGGLFFAGITNGSTFNDSAAITSYADAAWGSGDAAARLHFEVAPDNSTTREIALTILSNKNVGIGSTMTSPTARLQLAAGTSTIGPLKLTSGTVVTTIAGGVQDGLIEYDGTHLSIVIGSTRFQLDQQSAGSGANTALSNLVAVAINTSLISDANNTDDLGSAAISWKDVYARTIQLDGSTSGTAILAATAVAGTPTLTLPTISGTLVQYVETSVTSSATPTPTGNARENIYDLTALAASATFAAPSGTPANHNSLLIRIKDNGTARTLSFNVIYRAGEIALPTTTVISKTMYLQFVYNSADSKWDLIGLTEDF